jgi:DNA-directed RNA polymerase subunit RPC12/RpoP
MNEMWPFGRKKQKGQLWSEPQCSHCGSTNIVALPYHGNEQPYNIKTWRGERYITYRCLYCGRDFYVDAMLQYSEEEDLENEKIIYDEDELRIAEEELRKQADDDEDHSYNPYKR